MGRFIIALSILAGLMPVQAGADPVVEIGQMVRAILLKPANPKGAVILFAGGDGRLDITPAGDITKLRFNQLVRTRALYASAGYVTLVPDIAPSFKAGASGVVELYRASRAFAQDVGAMVKYLRGIVPKPVVVVGTSRGSLSVANAVAKLKGEGKQRPDAAVLTAAFLKVGANVPGLTECSSSRTAIRACSTCPRCWSGTSPTPVRTPRPRRSRHFGPGTRAADASSSRNHSRAACRPRASHARRAPRTVSMASI